VMGRIAFTKETKKARRFVWTLSSFR